VTEVDVPQVDRPRSIELTWVFEATKGVEPVVPFTLVPKGNHTEVTLRHSGVPDDETGRRHEEGWTWDLSILAERLTSGGPVAPDS
jgi:Activator of Hsp90 ATPase homolog 1-like protein